MEHAINQILFYVQLGQPSRLQNSVLLLCEVCLWSLISPLVVCGVSVVIYLPTVVVWGVSVVIDLPMVCLWSLISPLLFPQNKPLTFTSFHPQYVAVNLKIF